MNPFRLVRRHRKALPLLAAGLAVAGVGTALRLPVSLFPDIDFPRIVILADNGEQPAERMMVEVTKPLEEVASSVPGVETVRSVTGRGSAEISLGLSWHVDVEEALQTLQNRAAERQGDLPPATSIRVERMSVAVFPVLGYSLTSDTLSLVALRDLALYQVRPAITRVPGVSRVQVTGGETQEFHIVVSPDRLAAYRLGIGDVTAAIAAANELASAGLVENNYHLYLTLVSGMLTSAADIGGVAVATRGGIPVTVGDVATVEPGVAPQYIRTTANGKPAVLVDVIKQPTASTVAIGAEVRRAVAGLNLPPGVSFSNWYDQGAFINRSITGTRDSIVIGVVLSMVVLLAFLRSWRIGLVVILVVPATIAITLLLLKALGQTINIMTLGGIAAAVGLIIDDSIVVIESIFTQLGRDRSGERPGRAAYLLAAERSLHNLLPAIIGSTACTVVINIPLLFLGNVTGAFFAPLAATMMLALGVSFLLSITVTPLLVAALASRHGIAAELRRATGGPSRPARAYERLLRAALRRRLLVVPVVLAIAWAAWAIYRHTGSGFLPDMDEGAFVLDYASPPGTSLTETNAMLEQVGRILTRIPEVASYSRRTGTELGFFLTEPNTGDFLVKLRTHRSRSIWQVMAQVRREVEAAEPKLQIDFGQLMGDLIGDLTNAPKPIELKLFGDSVAVLEAKAAQVARLIAPVPGVVDVFDGVVISGPSFVVDVDQHRAARFGLTAEEIQAQLAAMVEGDVASSLQRGEKLIGMRVQYPDRYRTDLAALEGIRLAGPDSALIPLADVADFRFTAGQTELDRENLRPVVAVSARVEGRDLGGTIARIKRLLARRLTLPPGVRLEYGGVYRTQQESFRGLLVVAVAAFLMVFLVLLFEFGELTAALSVLTVSLLSLLGVVAALFLTGTTFNISSFVGLIMILGIVAENGVFVIHEYQGARQGGADVDAALVAACTQRARPVAMTALAAILALLPLAVGLGTGAQMLQPLAIAVIGGFCVSTPLLFLVLPLLVRLLADRG